MCAVEVENCADSGPFNPDGVVEVGTERGWGRERDVQVSQRIFKALRYGAAQTTLVKNGNAPCSSASGMKAVSS
jgi:hypothetical protein